MNEDVNSAARLAIYYAGHHKAEFIEEFVKIEDKDTDEVIIPFRLWPEQRELLSTIEHSRRNVILKARQLGITWLVLAYIAAEAIAKSSTAICFSRTEFEAKELIRRLEVIFSNMRGLCSAASDKKADTPFRFTKNALSMEIQRPDGMTSRIDAFPSAGGASRSFTANVVFFDEWAFQLRAREIWASAFPTINRPTGGKVIGLSTIERGTLFEELVLEHKEKGFTLSFLPWYTDPRRDKAWYNETKKAMGDLIMAEYPATVEEAMTIPGGCYFPEVKEETHIRGAVYGKKHYYISIDYGLDMLSVEWFWVDSDGKCRCFREFHSPNLVISEACREILRYTSIDGEPQCIIAPPDLWSREQVTGRSRADIFAENGVYLVKASNALEDGCMALKQMLYPDGEPELTFDECCPQVFSDLKRIQKDPDNPNVYAKTPHELTHSVDAARYFAVFWRNIPGKPRAEKSDIQKYKEKLIKGRKRHWR